MRLSDTGLRFIADEEGFVPHAYDDFAGVPTIGYGHVIRDGERFPATLSSLEALALLRADVALAEARVNTLVTVDLTQSQFDALVSFTFNCGGHALATSTLLRYLNEGDYVKAADEFTRWAKARIGGHLQVAPVLLRRRRKERAMFLTDDEPAT